MSEFKVGDRVLVNGGSVAEIAVYDEGTDVLVYITKAGSSTDRTTAHISQTRLEYLVSDVVTSDERPADEQPELPFEAEVVEEPPAKSAK